MDDLISRQAAIDLIENDKIGGGSPFVRLPRAQVVNRTCDRHVEGIKNLPSAQPDVPDTNFGDLISREAMGNALNRMRVSIDDTWYSFYQKALNELCNLPSAQKTGKWLHERLASTTGGTYPIVRCSACMGDMPFEWTAKYCPNCGARMEASDHGND